MRSTSLPNADLQFSAYEFIQSDEARSVCFDVANNEINKKRRRCSGSETGDKAERKCETITFIVDLEEKNNGEGISGHVKKWWSFKLNHPSLQYSAVCRDQRIKNADS